MRVLWCGVAYSEGAEPGDVWDGRSEGAMVWVGYSEGAVMWGGWGWVQWGTMYVGWVQ